VVKIQEDGTDVLRLSDSQKEWVKSIGVGLIVIGNLLLSLLGIKPQDAPRQLLTKDCENWLLDHDDFTVPPLNCREELRLLQKRLDKEEK
jgi:hypothetical protein